MMQKLIFYAYFLTNLCSAPQIFRPQFFFKKSEPKINLSKSQNPIFLVQKAISQINLASQTPKKGVTNSTILSPFDYYYIPVQPR